MEEGSVVIQSFLAILRAMDGRGLDRGEMLRVAKLQPQDLADPDSRIPLTSLYDIYEHVAAELDDPALPIDVATSLTLADLHVMGFAIETSETGEEALRRAVRYVRLAFDAGYEWSITEHDDQVTIRYDCAFPRRLGNRIALETAISQFVHHFRTLTSLDIPCTAVRFPHVAPADIRRHRSFFQCDVLFDAGECSFTFQRIYMEQARSPKANKELGAFFVRYAEELLKERSTKSSVSDQTRRAIERALATGEPTADRIARSLAMSDRSLRRALKDEGTSFRAILDGVREHRAKALLSSREATVSDIAFLLGFSDVSTFSRAFKRWTGESPRAFRSK